MKPCRCVCPGCHRIALDGAEYCAVCIACGCHRKRTESCDPEELMLMDANFLDPLSDPE